MTDSQYDPNVVADQRAGGPATAPKATVPVWVWGLISLMGTLIVVGAVLIVLMLTGWLGQRPGGIIATGSIAATSPVQPGMTVVTPPSATTGGGTSGSSGTNSGGGGTSGSSGTNSGGGTSGSSGTNSGGGGTSGAGSGNKTGPTGISGLVAQPNLGALVAGWQKVYPAGANPYFDGVDKQWTQPFSLPAGKIRIEFVIAAGAAQTVDVAIMDNTGSEPGHYWTVPGTVQTYYFDRTMPAAGQWYIEVIPHTGTISWRVKVSRWGLP